MIYLKPKDRTHKGDLQRMTTFKVASFSGAPVVHRHYVQMGDIIMLPVGREDLIPPEYEIVDKRITNPVEFPKFQAKLRPSQQRMHDEIDDSWIINAPPAFGKTFTAISLITKFGQKTLILTHTTVLRDQWVTEIQKTLGITPSQYYSGKLFEFDNRIVVGNIQSVIKSPQKFRDSFGLVVIDECHRLPSKTFKTIVTSCKARYKMALTATLKRKDGQAEVIKWYTSTRIFKAEKENYMPPVVKILQTPFNPGHRSYQRSLAYLAENPNYIKFLAGLLVKKASEGHCILLVSARRLLIDNLRGELIPQTYCCITGDTPQEERQELLKKVLNKEIKILIGSTSIFTEGVSVNTLSCLIMATPLVYEGTIEQLIGRITRVHEDKLQPEVLDLQLEGVTGRRQLNERMKFYLDEGLEVSWHDLK